MEDNFNKIINGVKNDLLKIKRKNQSEICKSKPKKIRLDHRYFKFNRKFRKQYGVVLWDATSPWSSSQFCPMRDSVETTIANRALQETPHVIQFAKTCPHLSCLEFNFANLSALSLVHLSAKLKSRHVRYIKNRPDYKPLVLILRDQYID